MHDQESELFRALIERNLPQDWYSPEVTSRKPISDEQQNQYPVLKLASFNAISDFLLWSRAISWPSGRDTPVAPHQ